MPNAEKCTIHGPEGLRLILDRGEVFPEDPGNGTPAMLEDRSGQYASTLWCAADTGELLGHGRFAEGALELTPRQLRWAQDDAITLANDFLYPETTSND